MAPIFAGAGLLAVAAISLAIAQPSRPSGSLPGPPLTASPDGRKLALTFADEFDSFRPVPIGAATGGVWRTMYGDGKKIDLGQRTIKNNNEAQIYVDREMKDQAGALGLDPFKVGGGTLKIIGQRASPGHSARLEGYKYTSGMISSQPSFSQTYGYFEIRAKTPKGKGLWPAFWMLPADLSWPPEIDVMENIGDPGTMFVASHSAKRQTKGKEVKVEPGWHTFAVAWDAQELTYFIDGREIERHDTPADMHKPMFLVANLALGGGWAGPPDDTTPSPATYEIDFIRAYRFAS